MSILFAATYPERVWALVLVGSYARVLWAPDYPYRDPRGGLPRVHRADRGATWGTAEHGGHELPRRLAPSADEEGQACARHAAPPELEPGLSRCLRADEHGDRRPARARRPSGFRRSSSTAAATPRTSSAAPATSPSTSPGARHVELPGVGPRDPRRRSRAAAPGDRAVPDRGLGGACVGGRRARARARDGALHRHRGIDREGCASSETQAGES